MSNQPNILDRAADVLTSPPGQILVAGLIGGVLRWVSTEKGWKGGVASILSGLAAAWYLGPLFAALLAGTFGGDADSPRLVAGSAFFVGVGGISIVALLINVSKRLNSTEVSKRLVDAIVLLFTGKGPSP